MKEVWAGEQFPHMVQSADIFIQRVCLTVERRGRIPQNSHRFCLVCLSRPTTLITHALSQHFHVYLPLGAIGSLLGASTEHANDLEKYK